MGLAFTCTYGWLARGWHTGTTWGGVRIYDFAAKQSNHSGVNMQQNYQDAVNYLIRASNNKTEACRLYNEDKGESVPRTTFLGWLDRAAQLGIGPTVLPLSAETALTKLEHQYKAELTDLRRKVKLLSEDNLSNDMIRKVIFDLSTRVAEPPNWLGRQSKGASRGPGIPLLFLSDFHWGEVVDPDIVGNGNKFNLEIARKRLKNVAEITVDICMNHMVNPKYDGIVVALGGDMVSGDIHEELARTNDGFTIEHVFDLFSHLIGVLNMMLDNFPKVFVPTAYGNHGRITKQRPFKGAAQTNFDWMLYNMLEKHYQARGEKRIHFQTTTGYDNPFNIYDVSYLLTHGDRIGTGGGNGLIGAVGPIMRGAAKVRASSHGNDVDYVIMGHWHQYLSLPGVRVNGSLKGYDEFAKGMRFTPEPPQQSLWFTHPEHGVTMSMPILADASSDAEQPTTESPWVTF
jgi:hypothetical protein